MKDDDVSQLIESNGYAFPRRLPTGEWAAVGRYMFTTGLLVGVTPDSYRTRYCYEQWREAVGALQTWNGEGDPPGNWIKEKGYARDGSHRDRANPATCEHRYRDGSGVCVDCHTLP